jgi:carboxyl-terminal processing protease
MPDLQRPRRGWPPLLFLVAAFLAGVLLERAGLLPGGSAHEPAGLRHIFAPYWEAWDIVHADYVDRQSIDDTQLMRGSIAGMLESLGDVGHTAYLTPEEVQQMEADLKGQLDGIGATIGMRKRRPTIAQTMPDSPARAAGLKPGDVLLRVDGKDVDALSLEQIVQRVRGPAGTQVRLTVLREGTSQPLDLTITRARLQVSLVAWHMLPGAPVAHVALLEFGEHAADELGKALAAARAKGARALILDVRNNPGGIKDQAIAVTSEFLKPGQIVFVEQNAEGRQTPVPVEPATHPADDLPLCLLVDEGTASSAEILAGALQDYGRATLVGTRTFGTGTVLKPFELTDGSAVLLAVEQWLTPKGRRIWHEGIQPDVEVVLPADAALLHPDEEAGMDAAALQHSQDKQLLKALEILKKRIP